MAANGTPWHTDRSFVSPWNYLDKVMQGAQFPKRVKTASLKKKGLLDDTGFRKIVKKVVH